MSGGVAVEITCTPDCRTLDEPALFIRSLAAPNDLPISISATSSLEYQAVGPHDIARCFRTGIGNLAINAPHFDLLVIPAHNAAALSVPWTLTSLYTITDANKAVT